MAKKKENPKCKECGMEMELSFDGQDVQYPVFSCSQCNIVINEWEKWWSTYSKMWKNNECWSNKKDYPSCLLGYFCDKYSEFFGYSYVFNVSSPIPFKCKEMVFIRRILAMLNNDAKNARTYIRWVFAKKIKDNRKKITSLGFFTNSEIVNEYLYLKKRSEIITRSTLLPNEFLNWCQNECPEVFNKHDLRNWNDLSVLVSYIKHYQNSELEKRVVEGAAQLKMVNIVNGDFEIQIKD